MRHACAHPCPQPPPPGAAPTPCVNMHTSHPSRHVSALMTALTADWPQPATHLFVRLYSVGRALHVNGEPREHHPPVWQRCSGSDAVRCGARCAGVGVQAGFVQRPVTTALAAGPDAAACMSGSRSPGVLLQAKPHPGPSPGALLGHS